MSVDVANSKLRETITNTNEPFLCVRKRKMDSKLSSRNNQNELSLVNSEKEKTKNKMRCAMCHKLSQTVQRVNVKVFRQTSFIANRTFVHTSVTVRIVFIFHPTGERDLVYFLSSLQLQLTFEEKKSENGKYTLAKFHFQSK